MVSDGRADTRWCVTGNDRTHWPVACFCRNRTCSAAVMTAKAPIESFAA
jgi:hypothetical protein